MYPLIFMKKISTTPEQVMPNKPSAGATNEELRFLMKLLKIEGYSSAAAKLGMDEAVLRKEVHTSVNSLLDKGRPVKTEVEVKWSLYDWSTRKNWIPKKQSGYVEPGVIKEITDLLDMFFLELALITEDTSISQAEIRKQIGVMVEDYLMIAQAQAETAVRGNLDDHACIHILEVATTFNMTVVQVLECVLGYPNKMESEEKPKTVEFYCHPLMGGLTVSDYIYTQAEKKKISQKPRSPSSKTNRVGQGISFEELANIYRTSRVTLANTFNKTMETFKRKLKGSAAEYREMLTEDRHY
jgi:hypothetical protein